MMVCWADNVDWNRLLKKLGQPVGEEEKSKAIYDLQDEMGHDYLKSLPLEEIEKLLLAKLAEKKSGKETKKPAKSASKRTAKKKKQLVEEESSSSSYI
jgi:hypothetical protein